MPRTRCPFLVIVHHPDWHKELEKPCRMIKAYSLDQAKTESLKFLRMECEEREFDCPDVDIDWDPKWGWRIGEDDNALGYKFMIENT